MKTNIIIVVIVAGLSTSGLVSAQDMVIEGYDPTGDISWANAPADHIGFVAQTPNLSEITWSNVALSLEGEEATLRSLSGRHARGAQRRSLGPQQ